MAKGRLPMPTGFNFDYEGGVITLSFGRCCDTPDVIVRQMEEWNVFLIDLLVKIEKGEV